VRAGLAQVGIVTRATVGLVRAPGSVRRAVREYPDLAAMLDDARRLVTEGGLDEVQGAVVPGGDERWTYRLETAVHADGERPSSRTGGGWTRWRPPCGPTAAGRTRTRG
jgi:FAD/FMN-containing dehydrogenase